MGARARSEPFRPGAHRACGWWDERRANVFQTFLAKCERFLLAQALCPSVLTDASWEGPPEASGDLAESLLACERGIPLQKLGGCVISS